MDPENSVSYTPETNRRLIDLAFECVFINSAEKDETLKYVKDEETEETPINVLEFFIQKEFVSKKRTQYLLDLDSHLQTRQKDKLFGKIAAANQLVSQEEVDKALNHQKSYFDNNRIHMKIGDILVGNGSLAQDDLFSILLTQNRIKDEDLLEALNELGKTQREKDGVNKRFGVLAIKHELVTIDQVNEAFDIQETERKDNGQQRFIGQILQEISDLSDTDLATILHEQKQYEKRRLDLEQALYSIKEEIKISKQLNRFFEYTISTDGLEATVKKLKLSDKPVPTYEFLIWLRRVGIHFGTVEDHIIEEFIQTGDIKSSVCVAMGHPPEPCVDETIEIYFENEFIPATLPIEETQLETDAETQNNDADEKESEESAQEDESGSEEKDEPAQESAQEKTDDPKTDEKEPEKKSNKSQEDTEDEETSEDTEDEDDPEGDDNPDESPVLVEKGSLIAKIIPGKTGRSGKNVLGHVIFPGKPSVCTINAGTGVAKRGLSFYALQEGVPVFKNGTTLMVEPQDAHFVVKKLSTPVCEDTKGKYEGVNVELDSHITPEGVLRCHHLLLNGNLQGRAICTGDVEIKGAIKGEEKDVGEGGVHQADIFCKGVVKISKPVTRARIQTEKEFLGFNSTLHGVELIAFNGITLKDCLSDNETPSTLQFGLMPGDKSLPLIHTIEKKEAQLKEFKKEEEIATLTQEYERELEETQTREFEKQILTNLVEMIKAPELFMYEELKDKINYLYGLPDFSSIKSSYLRLPEADLANQLLDKILSSIEGVPLDDVLKGFEKKLEFEPSSDEESDEKEEEDESVSEVEKLETGFKARLAALEKEVEDQKEEIEKLEAEIQGLLSLKAKFEAIHVNTVAESNAAVIVRNKCEKGTLIKGKVASLVLENDLHKVRFEEVVDPKTRSVSIVVESY